MVCRFSIHTFEIVCDVGVNEYDSVLCSFFQYSKSVRETVIPIRENTVNGYWFSCLKSFGINRVVFKTIGAEVPYMRQIRFIVNPRVLLGIRTYPYICIVAPERIEEIPEKLDIVVQKIAPSFPSIFHSGHIRRIDYCANINLKSAKHGKRYLNILRQGYFSSHFRPVKVYNAVKKRTTFKNGSMTLESPAYTFEAYLKREQMIQSNYNYDENEILEAEGQIRFELRARYRKVYELKRKYKTISEYDFLCRSSKIAKDEITRILIGAYGTGDFYNIDVAKDKIQNSNHTLSVKNKMIEMVDLTREKRSLTAAVEALKLTPPQRRIYFSYFNQINVSPITFGKSGHNYRNPLVYIQNANVNERS